MIFNRLFYEFNVVNSRFIVIEIHRMRSSLKRNYVSIFDNINNELASSNILPVLDIFRQAIFGDSTANRTIFKISNMLQNKFIWLFKGNWLWLTYFCTDIFVNANTWGAGLDWKRCLWTKICSVRIFDNCSRYRMSRVVVYVALCRDERNAEKTHEQDWVETVAEGFL